MALDGTIVIIPAGTCTWTTRVVYNQVFSTTISGSGSPTGSDSLGNPTGYNDQTILLDNVADSNNPGQYFFVNTASGKSLRVTGVTFQTHPSQTFQSFHGIIAFSGNSQAFRFDHNHVSVSLGTEALVYNGGLQGVIDHNYFELTTGVINNFIEMQGSGWKGLSESAGGDQSWADLSYFGSQQFVFTENNTFNSPFSTSSATGKAFDCQFGGRGVFRHNTLLKTSIQTHGTGFDVRDRGCRAIEVYGNLATGPSPNFAFFWQLESGTTLLWGNTISGYNSMVEVDTVRANNITYTQSAPPNGWGYCGNQVSGVTSVWDQNLSTDGHACMDGVGMGKGDLLIGGSGGNFTGTLNNATGTQTWPHQLSDPAYFWGNSVSGLVNAYVFALSSPGTIENREWYTERPNFSSASAFDGTVGVGCGPIAGAGCANPVAQPASCTAGVGYWNSANSTFYVCGAGNIWITYYTPYTYPHPLAVPVINALLNLNNVSPSAPGTQLTQGVLTNGTIGSAFTWASSTGTAAGMTVGNHQNGCGLPEPVSLNSTTYTMSNASQSFSFNDNNNFTYWETDITGNSTKMSFGVCITFGTPASATGSHLDRFVVYGQNGHFAALQQCPGTVGSGCNGYTIWLETDGASGNTTTHSPQIIGTPGATYWCSQSADFTAGLAQLSCYQPTSPYTQIGATVTAPLITSGERINKIFIGNSEVLTANSTTFFENMIADTTNAIFPLGIAPTTSQGWTYVQESVITYCANNTSTCSAFTGTMIPTRSDTVWIFAISTTNDVTASVSGGGATWTECGSCTTFLSGFRRNRIFYAIGGTAGSTNFTITLSGNSGSSFAVTFVEILPPPGTTASFDTGGAVSSSTCTGICTGVGLTLAATDAVVQFMNRIAPADYKSWPGPYISLPNGDGLHLNAPAGTETAPIVSVAAGTGSVFSAIAFKSTGGSFTPPKAGPMSLVSFTDPDPASGLTGLNCNPNCTLTVPSTGVGHLLYLEAANTSGVFLSSVSGGGTWVVPASCQIKGGQAAGNSLSCAYALSSSFTPTTSINITMAGTANTQFAFYEVATTGGGFAFDTAGTATNAASSNPSGVSLTLAAGATDVVFQSIFVFGGTSSVSYYPNIRGCRSGCGPQFWNGQAASDVVFNVSGTAPVPQWSNQQNNATVVSGVAFRSL